MLDHRLSRCYDHRGHNLIFLLFLAMIVFVSGNSSRSPEEDRLKRFFEVTEGPRWQNNQGWNTSAPVCTWFGITCEGYPNDPNRGVISIVLPSNNLVGRVAKLMYQMPHLRILNLKDNSLRDGGFGGMSQDAAETLEVLDLAQNSITQIDGIGMAPSSLHELHLTENNIDSVFPVEITQLTALKNLYMSFNDVKGTLPTEIGLMESLEKLYFYGNSITGQIPSEIGMLGRLQILTLAENALSGTIPREVSRMTSLETFSVHNDDTGKGQLKGRLPPFDSATKLNQLYFQGNALSGSIPPQFLKEVKDVGELIVVDLAGNDLTGSIPDALVRFSSLSIDVTGNQLAVINDNTDFCNKKAWIKGLVETYGCDAIMCPPGTYNQGGRQDSDDTPCQDCPSAVYYGSTSCGSNTPTQSDDWKVLVELYTSLRGSSWDNFSGWSTLDTLLSNKKIDQLDGSSMNYCAWFGILCLDGSVTEIRLDNNRLVGTLPVSVFKLPNLRLLDVSRNAVELDPSAFDEMASPLLTLVMSGTKVDSLGGIEKASSLVELYVDGLDLGGTVLPTEIFQLTKLETLHIQYSYFTGSIPSEIGVLTELRRLNVYNNELTGSLPTELGLLTKLRVLELSENSFTGSIPSQLDNLIHIEKFHIHQVAGTLKGTLPAFSKFPNIFELSLDSNQFSGTIPSNFLSGVVDKTKAITVGLSFNNIVGSIPSQLSAFEELDIQLEGNKISGIPNELCQKSKWMGGEVGVLGSCDVILCPPKTWNLYGKASSKLNAQCTACDGNELWGSTVCGGDLNPNPEKKILDNLFTLTGGRFWKRSTNWTEPGVPICYREGVICDGSPDHDSGVTELDLLSFGLNGLVPPEIFDLPKLRMLGLTNNEVDVVFDNIAQATSLRTLKLSRTQVRSLEGIGGAPSRLTEIHLADNELTGEIPLGIFLLRGLQQLFLNGNQFTGTLADDIINMDALENLYLQGNSLTGHLPTQLGGLTNLKQIDFTSNMLSGNIPTEIDNLVNLEKLLLGGQRGDSKMSGPLTSFSRNGVVMDLDLSGNDLTGTIPSNFLQKADPGAQINVNLERNRIIGTIPTELNRLQKLTIQLADNEISEVPEHLCDQDNDAWMDGKVGELGCDAILCPPGRALPLGRQIAASQSCQACDGGVSDAPFWGATRCTSHTPGALERNFLIQLYQNSNGTNWIDQSGWNSESSVCTWFGVTCDDEGVVELNLEENGLESTDSRKISSILFSLPFLKKLTLSGNKIPLDLTVISAPSPLQVLKVSATGLRSLAGVDFATDLRRLHLTDNKLNGPIPRELFELTSLRALFLSFNSFTGTLPDDISKLTLLEEFYLYGNKITGTLPNGGISALPNLKEFIMSDNLLTGTIPQAFSDLPALEQLSLYQQQGDPRLSGTLPDFAGAPKLWYLDVNSNDMTGTIPPSFLSNSVYRKDSVTVNLSNNKFNGRVPTELDVFENLDIEIVGNKITDVPSALCDNAEWMQGDVGKFGSCAAIACPPGTFNNVGRQTREGQQCAACDNPGTSNLWGQTSCDSEEVTVERNILLELYKETDGDSWDLNAKWNSDEPICSWSGIDCGDNPSADYGVTDIQLESNNLIGTLPSSIWKLPDLLHINLKQNDDLSISFTGISDATKLELLYLSDTKVDSLVGISQASSLKELHLTGCGIGGTFPEEIFDLKSTLKGLYIAFNFFSGTVSSRFGEMSKLKNFYAFDNDFSGELPSQLGRMSSLDTLVLSENLISGSIPNELSSLSTLRLLSLYRRSKPGPRITGPLPAFDQNLQLTDLYLDNNDITGTIPSNFLGGSPSASLIILSHNHISGAVPESLKSIESLEVQLQGNEITSFPNSLCDKTEWMNGDVGSFGCDGFLCPPGHATPIGRTNSTVTCQKCQDSRSAGFFGSITCDDGTPERDYLVRFYQQCGGRNWYNKDGWVSNDPICDWYGVTCNERGKVASINLGSNNLVGTPPPDLFALPELERLYLFSNPLRFSFDGIELAARLTDLRVDSTSLSTLRGIEKAQSLTILDARFNGLSGNFPTEVMQLKHIRSLNLAHNNFEGPLPSVFAELRYLDTLRLDSNNFTGKTPSFDDMYVLTTLDLANNQLSGSIPRALLDLVTTNVKVHINLASNQIVGAVPIELRRFGFLTILLRDNQIRSLPKALCDNHDWNGGDVENHGCDGILCPPETYNRYGRYRVGQPCKECLDKPDFYGQVSCDAPKASSSPSAALSLLVMLVGSALVVCTLI